MPGSRRTAAGPAAADEQYRQRALEQLWRFRDEELVRAGHSAPAYVAARLVNELTYPQPLPSMSKYALDDEVLGRINEILTGLPDRVHSLLGPQLTYPTANSGARTG